MAEAGVAEAYNQRTGELTDNARVVLQRRYLSKDREGNVLEDSEGMFRRVAHNLSQSDFEYGATEAERAATEERFYQVMRRLEFLPNSPTLMNAGRELQQLSACFVLPVEDSLDSIFTKVKQTALIHKSGGGTGFAFSRLRPEGDVVGSTGGVASGPVSFINAFDAATDVVKQGGTRRGANMGILHVTHPDILRFITSKEDGQHLSNFNISVAVTEDFMQRVEHNQAYDLVNPRTGQITGQLNAREVFERMTELAWRTGDPGIVFLDRINRDNPNPQLGDIESTNPCGEQPLLPYESCNLGSLNLARMVRYSDDDVAIDWRRMSEVITTAVHMLDCVIDMNDYPIEEIAEMSRKTRRIGLGVMGWSDLLIQLGIRYDSDAALALAEQVMQFIQNETYRASSELTEARGPFPEWERSAYNRGENPRPMRNSAPVTIAPTGTISIIAGASSGIEPLFALSYVRNVMDNTRLVEGNSYFEAVARHEGFYSEELMEQLAASGSLEDLDVPGWVKEVFRVSHDIDPRWHVRMQAAFQTYTDNAVSKTINFPHDATVADVAEAYQSAYALGCKGITVYRDGSKADQVLSTGASGDAAEASAQPAVVEPTVVEIEVPGPRIPRERPRRIQGITERVRTGHGNMYVTVNLDDGGMPFEVFGTMGKAGGCDAALLEAVSRLISLALRAGIDTSEVTRQLHGITCCPAWDEGTLVRSGPDAVAIVLDRIMQGINGVADASDGVQLTLPTGFPGYGGDGPQVRPSLPPTGISYGAESSASESGNGNGNGHGNGNGGGYTLQRVAEAMATYAQRCPECNGGVVNQEGCLTCYSCGWNKCE
ncbi:MAG: vitamin B12-dependent ribonucleotide reductase [Chloroflexi bacterium]|nr:vitamin B12-dependent ribonucleotide reductase [Chloroflexota bacterium]MYD48505.1 vitamin B12-dependent ribonucleotide reductase [Chloroflexota bacterium]